MRSFALTAALLALALARPQAQASDEVTKLLDSSTVIATGRVTSVSSMHDGTAVYTYVSVNVADVLKGALADRQLVVKQLGGVTENLGLHIEGQARFATGDDVLLFLAVRPRDGTLYTVGLSSGVWRLVPSLQSGRLTAVHADVIIDVSDLQTLASQSMLHDQRFVAVPAEFRAASGDGRATASYTFIPDGPARWHEADDRVSVPVDYATASAERVAALDGAIAAWNGVGTTLSLARAQTGPPTCPISAFSGSGRIALYWDDPCSEIADTDATTFGIGGGYFTPGNQKTINGVVFQKFLQGIAILNNTGPHLATSACLQDAVTHVLGHAVGLGDSSDSTAVMFRTLRTSCTSGASGLGNDDLAGLRAIYPALTNSAPPAAPTRLTATTTFSSVVLSWTPATTGGTPDTYVVEAGSSPTLANLAVISVAGSRTSIVVGSVPPGVYYVRVRARNALGTSAASNETTVSMGVCATPAAPSGLSYTLSGQVVSLQWTAPASASPIQSYILSAGFSAGQSNALVARLGPTPAFRATAPSGDYFVRVQAVNACGPGPASADLLVRVQPCTQAPLAPTNLTFTKSGNLVTLSWTAPSSGQTPSRYRLTVGSVSGGADFGTIDTSSNATTFSASAPNGTYFVRMQSVNDCGVSSFSNEVAITVP